MTIEEKVWLFIFNQYFNQIQKKIIKEKPKSVRLDFALNYLLVFENIFNKLNLFRECRNALVDLNGLMDLNNVETSGVLILFKNRE